MEGIILTNERKQTVTTHNREFSISGRIVRDCIVEALKKNNINIKDNSNIILMFDGQEIFDGDYFYLHVNNQEEE